MTQSVIKKSTIHRWLLNTNALFEGDEHIIDWRTLLPEDAGTNHQRQYILRSCKSFMRAMIAAPRVTRGRDVASGTVMNWFTLLRQLVRWMIARDIWLLSKLTTEHISVYLDHCSTRSDNKKRVTQSTYRSHRRLIQQMWELRTEYSAPLRFNPSTLFLITEPRTRETTPWKPLDEHIALPLIQDALKWVDTYGNYLVSRLSEIWSITKNSVGLSKISHTRRNAQLCSKLDDDDLFFEIRQKLGILDAIPIKALEAAARVTEGACITIILFLVGIRVRELTSLNAGCALESIDENGNPIYHLKGFAAKDDGKERTWAMTAPVKQAIKILEEMHTHSRSRWNDQALIMQPRNGVGLTDPIRRSRRIAPVLISKRLISFANAAFRGPLPDSIRLHPHAARKTFARYVVMRDRRALESLAHHFGHVHRSITDGAYIGSDLELERLISEESRIDLAKGLLDLLASSHVGGKAGVALQGVRENHLGKPGFRGKKGLTRLVDKLIADGVQLAPCDWGYCVYSQALSACKGTAKGPNDAHRSPGTCSTCSNFAVTERHREWWETRYRREEEFLRQSTLPAQTIDIVRLRLSETTNVLVGLNNVKRTSMNISIDQLDEK
jgi:integrase